MIKITKKNERDSVWLYMNEYYLYGCDLEKVIFWSNLTNGVLFKSKFKSSNLIFGYIRDAL